MTPLPCSSGEVLSALPGILARMGAGTSPYRNYCLVRETMRLTLSRSWSQSIPALRILDSFLTRSLRSKSKNCDLTPDSLRRYALIVALWVGYCYVGLVSWPVFYYGGHISRP